MWGVGCRGVRLIIERIGPPPMWTSVLMFTYMVIMFKELVGDTCPDLPKSA